MDARRVRHLSEYLIFRALVCVVSACSPRMVARLSHSLAWIFCQVLPRKWTRHGVARENLRRAFGDQYSEMQINQIIFGMWEHLFSLVGEIVHLSRKLRLNNVVAACDFRNRDLVVRALCSGRPVMVVSGHFGNWEMAVSVFGMFGFPMGLVARDLDNPYLHRWFLKFRRFTGHRPISKNGGGNDIVQLLDQRGFVALLGDQDAGPNGMFVDFFGRPASAHKSIALLALEYEAIICVGYARRLNGETLENGWPRYEIGCEAVIDPLECRSADPLREVTQLYTSALERVVRLAPEQYFWVHRRWKSEPRVRASRKRLEQAKAA